MDFLKRWIVLILLNLKVISSEEFCNSEIFQPRCLQNEIIFIENAIYGRKKFGRCLSLEGPPDEILMKFPGFIGCYSDVRHIIEAQCAGRQHCEVMVVGIESENNCYKSLLRYLDVLHRCVKVVPDGGQCVASVATEKHHVSSIRMESCGRKKQPWMVESMVGQRINIKLLQLISSNKTKDRSGYLYFSTGRINHQPRCSAYAYVLDRSKNEMASICYEDSGSNIKRQSYESSSNNLEVFYEEKRPADGLQFLFSFEATGCSDLIAPADAWLKRTHNQATIGCKLTRLRWNLSCHGNKWVGVIGNCSYAHREEVIFSPVKLKPKKMNNQDQLVTVIAIVVVGLVLCLLIACIGIMLLKKYYAMNKLRSLKNLPPTNIYPMYNNFINTNKKLTPYDVSKSCHGDEGAYYPPEGIPLQQDNAHYFELDQALVNKQPSNN